MDINHSEPLADPRHEIFAQGLVQGETQVDAYEAAGYEPDRSHASRLAANGNIQARVVWLQKQAAERCIVSVQDQTVKLLDLEGKLWNALEDPSATADRRLLKDTIMDTAKLNGLIVDKAKIETDVKTEHQMVVDAGELDPEFLASLEALLKT